jgi:hypothetical protein
MLCQFLDNTKKHDLSTAYYVSMIKGLASELATAGCKIVDA